MAPATNRRQQERDAREASFLATAQDILLSDGYLGLTMDKLAVATGYAKGTLYLHFANKEDLICALLAQFQSRRLELLDRVADLDLRPRAKMMCFGLAAELFTRAYPENARIEPMLKISSLRNKATTERVAKLAALEARCFASVLAAAQAGQAAGDLVLREGEGPEGLVFGLWAMHVGANVLQSLEAGSCPVQGVELGLPALSPIAQRLLDGYAWKPLSTEFNYEELTGQILHDHFNQETERIAEIMASQISP